MSSTRKNLDYVGMKLTRLIGGFGVIAVLMADFSLNKIEKTFLFKLNEQEYRFLHCCASYSCITHFSFKVNI